MAKRKRIRVLQFVLPYPMFQPEIYTINPDDFTGGPAPTPRRAAPSVDADRQSDDRQPRLWKEAA